MKFFALGALIFPILLSAQSPAEPPYSDSFFAPGAPDNSAAISAEMKWKIYTKRVVAPRALLLAAFSSEIRQLENSPGKWGRGWDGYGKRFGTTLARNGIRSVFAAGVDSAFHLDPRVFRAPDGTGTGGRLRHALSQTIIAHTDSGGRSFAYGRVLGAFAAGEAGSLWQPRSSDGKFGDGLVYGATTLAFDAGRNVFREFWPDIRRRFRHKP